MVDHRTVDELDVLAYADGLLDDNPVLKDKVEEWLHASPELAARMRVYRAQSEALREAYGGRVHEPVPDRLLAALEAQPRWRWRDAARAAALVLLIVVTSVSGWLLGRSDRGVQWTAQWSAQDFLTQSYQEYIGMAVDGRILPAERVEPLNWLSEEISLTLRAPDLTELGYAIVDKRTVSDGEHQMVRLVYAHRDGRSFSLFLRPRWDERQRQLHVATENDISLAYWLEGPLASAIASQLSPDETLAIAESVRGALLDPDVSQPTMHSDPPAQVRARGEMATSTPPGDNAMVPEEPAMPSVPFTDLPATIAN